MELQKNKLRSSMKILVGLMLLTSFNSIAETTPNLYRHTVEKTMQNNCEKFSRCYSSELKKDPDYRMGIVMNWDITNTGKVKNAAITNSTTNNPKLHVCVLDILQTIKFDAAPSESEGHMIYPMILSKNDCRK
jgi:hypothetical protein